MEGTPTVMMVLSESMFVAVWVEGTDHVVTATLAACMSTPRNETDYEDEEREPLNQNEG